LLRIAKQWNNDHLYHKQRITTCVASNSVKVSVNFLGFTHIFSQPDTLLNLSMDRLQKEAIFMDDVEYAKVLQKLPVELRLFGGKLALENEDLDQPGSSEK
jgi:hypothetical protein